MTAITDTFMTAGNPSVLSGQGLTVIVVTPRRDVDVKHDMICKFGDKLVPRKQTS